MPTISCRSDVQYLSEGEIGVFRTERSMMRAICGVQLKSRRARDIMMIIMIIVMMLRLGLNEISNEEKLAEKDVKSYFGEDIVKICLSWEDALCRCRWSVGVSRTAFGLRMIRPPSVMGDAAGFKTWSLFHLNEDWSTDFSV